MEFMRGEVGADERERLRGKRKRGWVRGWDAFDAFHAEAADAFGADFDGGEAVFAESFHPRTLPVRYFHFELGVYLGAHARGHKPAGGRGAKIKISLRGSLFREVGRLR